MSISSALGALGSISMAMPITVVIRGNKLTPERQHLRKGSKFPPPTHKVERRTAHAIDPMARRAEMTGEGSGIVSSAEDVL